MRSPVALALLLVLLLLPPAATSSAAGGGGGKPAQAWTHDHAAALSQGTELYQTGRRTRSASHVGSAERLLRRALALAPTPAASAESYFYLGASLALGGRRREAMAAYEGCVAADRAGGGGRPGPSSCCTVACCPYFSGTIHTDECGVRANGSTALA